MTSKTPIEWGQVMDVFDCLGKDPCSTYIRAIKPPRGPGHKFVLDPPKAEKYVRDGWGLYYLPQPFPVPFTLFRYRLPYYGIIVKVLS